MTTHALATSLLSFAFQQSAPAQTPQDPPLQEQTQDHAADYRLTIAASNACTLLDNQCKGQKIQIRLDTPSGLHVQFSTARDEAAYVPFHYSLTAPNGAGSASATTVRAEHMQGKRGAIGWLYSPTPSTALDLGLYVVKGVVSADLTLNATAQNAAISMILPEVTLNGNVMQAATNIVQPATNQTMSRYLYKTDEKRGFYGGLTAAVGGGFSVMPNFYVMGNLSTQFGIDERHYGAGLGFAYLSDADETLGAKAVSICEDGAISTYSPVMLYMAGCARKVQHNAIYHKLWHKVDGYRGSYTARAEQILQHYMDAIAVNPSSVTIDSKLITTGIPQIDSAMGQSQQLINDTLTKLVAELAEAESQIKTQAHIPTVTTAELMSMMGVQNPYAKPHYTLIFGGAVQISPSTSVLANIKKDVSTSERPTFQIGLSHTF
jgi:hypothetical protein